MKTETENIRDLLQEAGLKKTAQRSLILSYLLNCNHHPTVDDVYQGVKHTIPGITVATVYNILSSFVERGIIGRLLHDDGILRFDLMQMPHHHVYNCETGEVIDFVNPELDNLLKEFFLHNPPAGYDPLKMKIQVSLKTLKS